MKIVGTENLPFARIYTQKLFYTDCWDSPPFAFNLLWAYEGFQGTARFAGVGDLLRETFGADPPCLLPAPGAEEFTLCSSLQKKVHKIIMDCAFALDDSTNLLFLVKERVSKLFAPSLIDFNNYINVELAVNVAKQLRPASALKVVKTWLNGWATSQRMHEEVILPCLFGCPGKIDMQIHYVQCPHLYAFCNYFFKSDSCPLVRLGLRNPEIHNLKIVACVFSAYHVMKAQVRDGRLNGMHEDTKTIHNAWSVFADALEAEAGEHRISYTVFSLPRFISFLINGHAHDPSSFTHQVFAPDVTGSGVVFSADESTSASVAPGHSSSSAGGSVFIRAAQSNAHNPFLHASNSLRPQGVQHTAPVVSESGAVSSASEHTSGSVAPGYSSSSARSSVFVPAAQDNAHNPILHAQND